MPGKGSPRRGLRVSDERWKAAQQKAAEKGKTVSEVLNDCLDKLLDEDEKK